jgi:hypothetical protein
MSDQAQNQRAMDLQAFVREALVQIIAGVVDAQRLASRAKINPKLRRISVKDDQGKYRSVTDPESLRASGLIPTNYSECHADIIEFDIAVTVESSDSTDREKTSGKEAGVKIHVVSADVGTQTKSMESMERARSHVTRVKFRIPAQFPTG